MNQKVLEKLPQIGTKVLEKQVLLTEKKKEEKTVFSSDEFILSGLVESGFITGSIKTVYERGKQDDFLNSLKNFIVKKDEEIKTLCSQHYEEFLQSVSRLKEVKTDSQILKTKIEKLNEASISSGNLALERAKRTLTYHQVDSNIESAIQIVETCRTISSLAIKANQQYEEGRYYAALKTLEFLEESLKKIQQHKFAKYFEQNIPILREKVRSDVERKFHAWLVEMKETHNLRIGEIMLKNAQKKMSFQNEIMKKLLETPTYDFTSLYTNIEEENLFDIIKSSETPKTSRNHQIDTSSPFSPVFVCKHIYSTLNRSDEFKRNYKANRINQIQQILEEIPKNAKSKDYQRWLSWVLGFITIEYAIIQSTQGITSMVELNYIWEKVQAPICETITTQFKYSQDSAELLSIKEVFMGFCYSLQHNIGLNVSPITDIFISYKFKFYDAVLISVKKEVSVLIDNEKYVPFEVSTPEEFLNLITYYLEEKRQVTFPLIVPFSTTLPSVCVIVTKLITQLFAFGRDLAEMDDMVKEGITQILNLITTSFDKVINSGPPLNYACQIAVNSFYLIRACKYFESIYEKHSNKRIEEIEFLQAPKKTLKEMGYKAEDTITNLMYFKIKEALKLTSSIQWQPTKARTDSHPFIKDIISYLESSSQSLKYLQKEKREQLMLKSFQLVSNSLLNLLMDEQKKINFLCLKEIIVDITTIESFAGTISEACKQAFSETKHIINYVLSQETSDLKTLEKNKPTIIDNYYKQTNSQEKTNKVTTILDKILYDTFKNITKNLSNLPQIPTNAWSFFGK